MPSPSLPRGTWSEARVREILDATAWDLLDADAPEFTRGERAAIGHIQAAGEIVARRFEDQRHHQALASHRRLRAAHEASGHSARTRDLLRMYTLFDGPVARTLDNELVSFLGTDGWTPGGNVYPWGIAADEISAFLERRPDRRAELLHSHGIVRRTTGAALRRDLATLRRHPVLAGTHPGLAEHLADLLARGDAAGEPFYAVPYSVAWPEDSLAISDRLFAASRAVADEDRDLATFLRLRSRDVLTDEIEPGDAAWTRGDLRRLDVVFGPHEVYDDDLFGVKTSYGLALVVTHEASTNDIRHWVGHLADMNRELAFHGRARPADRVPMASYDVLALYGAARDVAAEILPNDPDVTRRYGRKILFRRNLVMDPVYNEELDRRFAAVLPGDAADLTPIGNLTQTVGHELAHFLGPEVRPDGRTFVETIGEEADLVEELKAEVMSYTVALHLERAGEIGADRRRGVLAQLVLAGLRINPAHPSQPYGVLRTMILNRFLADGVVVRRGEGYGIDHERGLVAVPAYVAEIVGLQERGTREEVAAHIARWSVWGEDNARIAVAVKAAVRRRFSHTRGPLEAPLD